MLVVGAAFVIAGGVQAGAGPQTNANFAFHDHVTAGKKWHVEIQLDPKNAKSVKTLVVYSEQCKGTIARTNVPISPEGVVAATGGLKGYGTWQVNFRFVAKNTIVGTMRMIRADCDTGVLSYPNAITGNGRPGGAGHHGTTQKFADWARATPKQRSQAWAVHQRVLKTWRGITPEKAKRKGFHRPRGSKQSVGAMFHVYNRRYENDKRIFDAKRPESLMFWRLASGESVLVAPMFRVPAGKRPSFAGPIPLYHGHVGASGRAPNQMTHVWMVNGRKTAWANCLPIYLLEQYNPAFKWEPARSNGTMPFSKPC